MCATNGKQFATSATPMIAALWLQFVAIKRAKQNENQNEMKKDRNENENQIEFPFSSSFSLHAICTGVWGVAKFLLLSFA